MDMPTHERGPPWAKTRTTAQPISATLLGNYYALTHDVKYLLQLEILAAAGDSEAPEILRLCRRQTDLYLKDDSHANGQTTISED